MTRKHPLFAWILSASLALGALGCSFAFNDAMERGQAYQQAGNWDAAAQEYETAVRLKPDSPEARQALLAARHKQSLARVVASRAHLSRGELAQAVMTAREAYALYPQGEDARAAYTEARGQALARAEALLGEKKLNEALELARVVRRADPADPQAAEIEGRCLDAIATRGYDQALAYIERKKLGNALLAFRQVLAVRPGFKDTEARAAETRRALEEEIRFILVVERATDTDATALSLARRVEQSLLAWKPDVRFRLSGATNRDPGPGAQAVRIRPSLGAISKHHDIQTVGRQCEFVCGVDRVPNPAHEVASRRASDGERRMQAADAAVIRAQRAIDHARREVTKSGAGILTARAAEGRAITEFNRCDAKKKEPGENCETEKLRLKNADAGVKAALKRKEDADSALQGAESDLREAESEKVQARLDWEQSLRDLQATPTTVLVKRTCTHNYGVAIHTWSASVTLSLRAHVVGEEAPVDLPPTSHPASFVDEAFPGEAGKCAQVAAGDPLVPPSESVIEAALAERIVLNIQDNVATWYQGYVESYKADVAAAKAEGRLEDANESHVRYLLVGPGFNMKAAR
jgi:tetratricopeptide (TPR) repeat protein